MFRLVLLRGIIVDPPIMVQSKQNFPIILFLCITYNEIVRNSKSKPKNSHSCVPLSSLYLSYHLYKCLCTQYCAKSKQREKFTFAHFILPSLQLLHLLRGDFMPFLLWLLCLQPLFKTFYSLFCVEVFLLQNCKTKIGKILNS